MDSSVMGAWSPQVYAAWTVAVLAVGSLLWIGLALRQLTRPGGTVRLREECRRLEDENDTLMERWQEAERRAADYRDLKHLAKSPHAAAVGMSPLGSRRPTPPPSPPAPRGLAGAAAVPADNVRKGLLSALVVRDRDWQEYIKRWRGGFGPTTSPDDEPSPLAEYAGFELVNVRDQEWLVMVRRVVTASFPHVVVAACDAVTADASPIDAVETWLSDLVDETLGYVQKDEGLRSVTPKGWSVVRGDDPADSAPRDRLDECLVGQELGKPQVEGLLRPATYNRLTRTEWLESCRVMCRDLFQLAHEDGVCAAAWALEVLSTASTVVPETVLADELEALYQRFNGSTRYSAVMILWRLRLHFLGVSRLAGDLTAGATQKWMLAAANETAREMLPKTVDETGVRVLTDLGLPLEVPEAVEA